MNERKWNALIDSNNSPLSTLHSTIYIKNPAALSKAQYKKLLTYIENTNLTKRSRLIFSLTADHNQYTEGEHIRNHLENHLSCLTLYLLPLRKRIADFPSITTLYLHKLNVSLGKQIIGFETEAMDLMTTFSWPRNLDQLRHVLKELVTITHTSYITRDEVKQILNQESPTVSPTFAGLDLTQTLDDINYQIIQTVLDEENRNKEKTSRRLGISRSTLWRILKSHDSIM